MRTTLIAIALGAFASAACAGDPTTINPYRHLLDTPAELAQMYPDLTPTELNYLVFRVADKQSMLTLQTVPVGAITAINPSAFAGATRNDLAFAFPSLSRSELDELVLRIAAAASQ